MFVAGQNVGFTTLQWVHGSFRCSCRTLSSCTPKWTIPCASREDTCLATRKANSHPFPTTEPRGKPTRTPFQSLFPHAGVNPSSYPFHTQTPGPHTTAQTLLSLHFSVDTSEILLQIPAQYPSHTQGGVIRTRQHASLQGFRSSSCRSLRGHFCIRTKFSPQSSSLVSRIASLDRRSLRPAWKLELRLRVLFRIGEFRAVEGLGNRW
jgi:hypothetical protein